MELVNIFIRSAFVDNMIFAFFFGMCSYLAVSKTVKTAVGLGLAVIFVLTVTIPINFLIENYVLKEGALSWIGEGFDSVSLNYLTFIMFIEVILDIY
jgi:Na+-transporting NADH:ubiquinone oxidoreductase subunit E